MTASFECGQTVIVKATGERVKVVEVEENKLRVSKNGNKNKSVYIYTVSYIKSNQTRLFKETELCPDILST